MKFLIWSFEHQGWWKPDARGYCKEKQSAGRYDLPEAIEICLSANGSSEYREEAMVPYGNSM